MHSVLSKTARYLTFLSAQCKLLNANYLDKGVTSDGNKARHNDT